MTYFLDFDRTLFDTSEFLKYVLKRDHLDSLSSLSEVEIAQALDALVTAGTLTFKPGELTRFLFPDAVDFLRVNRASSVIVTAGNAFLQKEKLESTFPEESELKIFYTGDERKGPFMQKLLASYPQPWIFIDDKQMELDSVSEVCPDVSLYQMCRLGLQPAGMYKVLHTFAELP